MKNSMINWEHDLMHFKVGLSLTCVILERWKSCKISLCRRLRYMGRRLVKLGYYWISLSSFLGRILVWVLMSLAIGNLNVIAHYSDDININLHILDINPNNQKNIINPIHITYNPKKIIITYHKKMGNI